MNRGQLPCNAFPPWPLDKVELRPAASARGRRCVLLATGALNPVHLGHVAMFDRAKIALEADFGFEVVDGFLSPSHDLYLAGKHTSFLSAENRLEMCAAATKDHPLLAVGAWESSVAGRWPDFPEVIQALASVLWRRFSGDAPEVLYLCGEDHFRYVRGNDLPGVCVVSRAGRSVYTEEARRVYAIAPDGVYDRMSATQVRNALSNNDIDTLRAFLHPDVLTLLLRY